MRVKNKEIRKRRHRKEQKIKDAVRIAKQGAGDKPEKKAAAADKAVAPKKAAAKKPEADKKAAAPKKAAPKKAEGEAGEAASE